ncbi:hypothetical protein ACLMJK_005345 [Lecanora helva]
MFALEGSIIYLSAAVLAFAANPLQLQDGLLELSSPYELSASEARLLSSLNSSHNSSVNSPPLNVTVGSLPTAPSDARVRCGYSSELRFDDCMDALNTFVYPPRRNLSIGNRIASGQSYWDLDLPVRWVSGNGLCSFEVFKHGRQTRSLATGNDLVSAGQALIAQCVQARNGQGGTATMIGVNGQISLVMGRTTPRNVECLDDVHPYYDHCNELIASIPASVTPVHVFGPLSRAGVDQLLPKAWASRPPNVCLLVLAASSGQADVTDSSTFFAIWEAFVLLKAMCVRFEKTGRVSGLGGRGQMSLLVLPYLHS